MIIGGSKKEVVANIKNAADNGRFNDKVEIGDPELDSTRRKKLLGKYVKQRNEIPYHYRNWLARRIVDFITFGVNANTKVVGAEKIKHIKSGAIITSNHFNPVDTTIIRYGIKKARRYRMFIVSQDTNFAMKGFLGFLMRYADEIPVSKDKDYMERHFYRTLNNLLVNKKEYILIYPEQEMWFNYRKPRPPKRGAYFYAAKFNVPIISCFVEMKDMDKDDTEEFKRVKYVLHILDPIYPDPEKNERDNSFDMMKKIMSRRGQLMSKYIKGLLIMLLVTVISRAGKGQQNSRGNFVL